MKFFVPNTVMRWLGPAIVISIGLILIVGNPLGYELFCAGTDNCLATWVDALSGWAAALAAAVTIGSLFQQAKAAQQQTNFQLGDADPTFDAVQHAEMETQVVLQIRNWNRRAMIIRRIRLVTERKIMTMYISVPKTKGSSERPWRFNKSISRWSTKKFEPAIMIEGWVSREEPPPLLKLTLAAYFDSQIRVISEWQHIPIEIQYEMVGNRKISRLRAHVHLAYTATGLDGESLEDIEEHDLNEVDD